MRDKVKGLFILLLPIVLLIYTSTKIFVPGFIIYTDVTETVSERTLQDRYLYTYNDDIGETLTEKARLPLFYTIFASYKLTGLGIENFNKIKIISLILMTFSVQALYTYKLLKKIHVKEGGLIYLYAGTISGLLYVLNYWFANRILHFGLFFSTITVTLTFYYMYDYFFSEKHEFRKLLTLAVLLTIFSAAPHSLLFELLITFVFILYGVILKKSSVPKIKTKILGDISLFLIFYTLLNMYWILPFVTTLSKPDAVTSINVTNLLSKNAKLENSLSLKGYWWVEPESYYVHQQNEVLSPIQSAIAYLPLVMFLIYTLVIHHGEKKLKPILVTLFILAAFLSSSTWLSDKFYFWLMFSSPIKDLGWLFREFDKFGLILSFVYAVVIAEFFLILKQKNSKLLYLYTPLVIFLMLNYLYFYNRTLTENYTPQIIPNEFFEVNKILEDDITNFNTVWFPGAEETSWYSTKEVRYKFTNLFSSKPTFSQYSWNLNFIENLFDRADLFAVNTGKALDMIGAKYLVVRKDDPKYDTENTIFALDRDGSLRKLYSGTYLDLYRNNMFSGLAKAYAKQVITDQGYNILESLRDLNINTADTLINFSDKPANVTGLKTYYFLPDGRTIDAVLMGYKEKMVFPWVYSNLKEDGNPGAWKFGSLENLYHAETKIFLENKGLAVNQFDFGEGVLVARDGYKVKDSHNPQAMRYIDVKFKNSQINYLNGRSFDYKPLFEKFWTILASESFNTENIKALHIVASTAAKEDLTLHIRLQSTHGAGNSIQTVTLYPDGRGTIDQIIRLPEDVKTSTLSVWTHLERNQSGLETVKIRNLKLSDVSNFVRPVDIEFQVKNESCLNNCVVLARMLNSNSGGSVEISVGDSVASVYTSDPIKGSLEPTNRLEWYMVRKIPVLPVNTKIKLTNIEGLNVLNSLLIIPEDSYNDILLKADSILNPQNNLAAGSPPESFAETEGLHLITEKMNPTKYEIQKSKEGSGFFLGLALPYSNSWVVDNTRPTVTNGLINGWNIESEDKVFVAEYEPQKYFYYGLLTSSLTLIACGTYLVFNRVVINSARKSTSQG